MHDKYKSQDLDDRIGWDGSVSACEVNPASTQTTRLGGSESNGSGLRGDKAVLRLSAEQLRIEKRVVEGQSVRVQVVTDEVETPAAVMLRAETLDIQRVAIGRVIDEVPEIREEGGVTIIPIVEEIAVTEVRLVLKEELHVRRVETTRKHEEVVTLRRQRAEVEHIPPDGRAEGFSTEASILEDASSGAAADARVKVGGWD